MRYEDDILALVGEFLHNTVEEGSVVCHGGSWFGRRTTSGREIVNDGFEAIFAKLIDHCIVKVCRGE
jgi:hypothetical protein